MGLFWDCGACKAHEKALLRLAAELADQKDFILKLLDQNKELVDKVLALTSPVALREFRREAPETAKTPSLPPRPRFPGLNPPRRPPGPHVLSAPGKEEAEKGLDAVIKAMNG